MNASPTVWMVDDDPLVLKSGLRLFRGLGCGVEGFADGAALLQRLGGPDRPDLVLIDETMPGLRGSEVARRVLALAPSVRVVLCSGYGAVDGAPDEVMILVKPFTLEDLRQLLDEQLGRRS